MNWEEYHAERMKDAEFKAEYDALEEEYNELRRKLKAEISSRNKPRFRRYSSSLAEPSTISLIKSASTKVPSLR